MKIIFRNNKINEFEIESKILLKSKNDLLRIGFYNTLSPNMVDTDNDIICDPLDIMKASVSWAENGMKLDLYHDGKLLTKQQALPVFNFIVEQDSIVTENGLEPIGLIKPEEMDGIIEKSKGDKSQENLLLYELVKNKLSDYQLIKQEKKIVVKGSWFIGIRFDEEHWKRVEDGELIALSIKGKSLEPEEIET